MGVQHIYKKGLENDNYYVVTSFWTSKEQIVYKGKDFFRPFSLRSLIFYKSQKFLVGSGSWIGP